MREAMPARHSIRQALGGELGEHPTYEMLEQVVDGTADDVMFEIVASHRGVCARCDAEIRDLRSFAGRSPSSALPRWLMAAAAMIAVIFAGSYQMMRRRPAERAEKPAVREAAPRAIGASGYDRDDWNKAVRAALEGGAIERPAILAELRPSADVLRAPGKTSTTAIMAPVGVVIDSTTPLLTWRASPGRFVVSVYDGFERVARSASLRSPNWRVSPPLARGRTYAWQVEILREGASSELLSPPPAPPAFFHVLDETSSASLAEARRRFPGDHLLLGALHARFGMQQAAVDELRLYAAQRPGARNVATLADSVARW